MTQGEKQPRRTAYKLVWAFLSNLVVAVLLMGTYFFGTPMWTAVYSVIVLGVWLVLMLLIRYERKLNWDNIIEIGCHVLLTAPIFWVIRECRRRAKAESEMEQLKLESEQKLAQLKLESEQAIAQLKLESEQKLAQLKLESEQAIAQLKLESEQKLAQLKLEMEKEINRLKELISAWKDPNIVQRLVDPIQQATSLKEVLHEMPTMLDARLSIIVDRIQHCLDGIVRAVDHNGNYILFRRVIETLSMFGPEDHPETYTAFLGLLDEIFSLNSSDGYTGRLKQDIIDPVINALKRATPTQYNRINDLVQRVMSQGEEENELIHRVLNLLTELDWQKQGLICLLIFNAVKKRAFQYPSRFGRDFLKALGRLEHRVFWLPIESIREILVKSQEGDNKSLLSLNQAQYKDLCSTVFAPLGQHYRVFRRILQDAGNVKITCNLQSGKQCLCNGKSLSFKGVYSEECPLADGEKIQMEILSVQYPPKRFLISGKIAALHPTEHGWPKKGRGVLFEQADEVVAKELFLYISTHGS